jgi:hypothetical protein
MNVVVPIIRALTRVAVVMLAVRGLVAAAGVVATAVLVAAMMVVWLMAVWAAAVEPWLFASRFVSGSPSGPDDRVVEPVPVVGYGHVAFAEALSVVADAYLDECRRQAGLVDEDGFL